MINAALGALVSSNFFDVFEVPLAPASAASVLGAAALIACFLPARRATRISPMTALRTE